MAHPRPPFALVFGPDGLTMAGKVLVAVLTLWALVVVMPDALRIVQPLGTLGFSADNDGIVYGVDDAGPAAKAGVQPGDRLALDVMSCRHPGPACAQLLSVFGGMGGLQYVRADSKITLWIRAPGASRPRQVTIASEPEQHGTSGAARTLWRVALAADELGALAFILCGAWLFWRRPCTMTAGFFAYALWFNPGQYFEFYSWLQGRPVAMFVQESLQAIFQSIGYVGFVVLALYFPNDVSRPRLRWVLTALPGVFAVLTVLQFASFLNVFGIGTELITRASYVAGWSVDAAVLLYVLPMVLRDQPPEEKARTRWLLTGCVVGLSAFIFADFNEATTMSPFTISETTINLLYFVNVLTLAVVIYTIRHHRVVNVRLALTRGVERFGMIALVTALGAYLIHRVDEQLGKEMQWDEVAVSMGLVGATLVWERVQEFAIEKLDEVLFPRFRRAIEELQHLARPLRDMTSVPHVERTLIDRPVRALRISSAAVFRVHRSGLFLRYSSIGWSSRSLRELMPDGKLFTEYVKDGIRPVRLRDTGWAEGPLPRGVAEPTVVVPIRAFGRLHAVVLYGAHASGDDLSREEIDVLAGLAAAATLAYQSTEAAALRRQVNALTRAQSRPREQPV
jgi:hypothetical protein